MGVHYGARNPALKNGTVLFLDAANPNSYPGSGNTWFDLSGNKTNATFVNSATFNNVNGVKYISLNGSNQYISANVSGISDTTTGNRVAVECLAYGPMNANKMLMSWGYMKTDIFMYGGGIGYNTYNTDVYGISTTGLANKWNHWVFNFYRGDYTQASIYVNGVKQTLSQINGTQLPSNNIFSGGVLQIGAGGDGYSDAWYFATVRVYNRALADSEVSENFQYLRWKVGI